MFLRHIYVRNRSASFTSEKSKWQSSEEVPPSVPSFLGLVVPAFWPSSSSIECILWSIVMGHSLPPASSGPFKGSPNTQWVVWKKEKTIIPISETLLLLATLKKRQTKNLFERNQSLALSKKTKNYKITPTTFCWNQRPRVPEPMVTLPHHPEIAPGSLPKISLNLWRRDHRPQDAWIARYKAPGASAVRETVSTTVGWHSRDSTHGIYGVLGWFLGIIKPINTQYIGLI